MAVPTIRDVAREADVSVATVSRAINGIETLDPELAQRVLETVDRLGYVPNNVGRSLRRQHTNTWAVIVNGLNAFVSSLVSSIEQAAHQQGTSVYLGITGQDETLERRYVQAAISQRVSGLIVASTTTPDIYTEVDLPIVFADFSYPGTGRGSVTLDNELAGRLAAEHLAEGGYRRVALLGEGLGGRPVDERAAGFRAALASSGLGMLPEHDRRLDLSLASAKAAVLDLLAGPQPPDAIYCVNGPSTQGAYFALASSGASGVGLVGTDNEDWTGMSTPTVTVVSQPVTEIGETAARLLAGRVSGSASEPQQVVLEPSLIVRESTRRP